MGKHIHLMQEVIMAFGTLSSTRNQALKYYSMKATAHTITQAELKHLRPRPPSAWASRERRWEARDTGSPA